MMNYYAKVMQNIRAPGLLDLHAGRLADGLSRDADGSVLLPSSITPTTTIQTTAHISTVEWYDEFNFNLGAATAGPRKQSEQRDIFEQGSCGPGKTAYGAAIS